MRITKMDKVLKQDQKVISILGLKTINRIICNTDKGTLSLQIRKGEKNYHLVLDAVPLEKEQNDELMDILFPVKQVEVSKVNKETLTKPFKADEIFPHIAEKKLTNKLKKAK